jgi:hypothetical protein
MQTVARLEDTIEVRALPDANLGFTASSSVWLDADAAGRAGFVNPTPASDGEFALSTEDSRAEERGALLAELGHVSDLEIVNEADPLSGGIMPWALPGGVRGMHFDGVNADASASFSISSRASAHITAQPAAEHDLTTPILPANQLNAAQHKEFSFPSTPFRLNARNDGLNQFAAPMPVNLIEDIESSRPLTRPKARVTDDLDSFPNSE